MPLSYTPSSKINLEVILSLGAALLNELSPCTVKTDFRDFRDLHAILVSNFETFPNIELCFASLAAANISSPDFALSLIRKHLCSYQQERFAI